MAEVLDLPEVKAKLVEACIDPMPRGAQPFQQLLNAEVLQWRTVVAQTGFKMDN